MTLSRARTRQLGRLRNPRFREREGLVLVEGVRVVREALASPTLALRFAVASSRLRAAPGGSELLAAAAERGLSLDEVPDEELEALSATEHPQGILLVAEEPPARLPPHPPGAPRRLLLLDGVQDPGNVGTLIRGAWAFGLDAALALEGTADPWSPKAVRAGAGGGFHLPVVRSSWEEARGWLRERGIPLLAADPRGHDLPAFRAPSSWALVVGNEGAGIREELLREAAATLAIPMAPGVDSLNAGVAGCILLFALGTLASGGALGREGARGGLEAGREEP